MPTLGNPQALNRFSYTANNPTRFNDPTGHAWDDCGERSGYQCQIHMRHVKKAQANHTGPNIIGSDWTIEELIAVQTGWSLLIKEFGSEDALVNALGGNITFRRTPKGPIGKGYVGRAYEFANTILFDEVAFPNSGDKMTWYVLHEIAHIFDMNDSGWDPAKYKSNRFVEAYNSGCDLSMITGCAGAQWNPSNKETTRYGLSNGSIEDFADSFASTILHNNNMEYAGYGNVGQDRMNIINVLIAAYQ